jgi:hypothetical protein
MGNPCAAWLPAHIGLDIKRPVRRVSCAIALPGVMARLTPNAPARACPRGLQQDDRVPAGILPRRQRCERHSGRDRECIEKRGAGITHGLAVRARHTQQEDQAIRPQVPMLQPRRPGLRLDVRQASHRLDQDRALWGADARVSGTQIARDRNRHLLLPPPCSCDSSTESIEEGELRRVEQAAPARIGAKGEPKTDSGRVAVQRQEPYGRAATPLHQADLSLRAPQLASDPGLSLAAGDAGYPELATRLLAGPGCLLGGFVQDIASAWHEQSLTNERYRPITAREITPRNATDSGGHSLRRGITPRNGTGMEGGDWLANGPVYVPGDMDRLLRGLPRGSRRPLDYRA